MNFKLNVMSISYWLERWARFSVTQPLTNPVSANDEAYLIHTGTNKLGWRHLRRLIYFKSTGQQEFYTTSFHPAWRRGLWLYRGVPQVGDALMDLAPRSLLAENGLLIDLCTDAHIAALYENDPWFDNIFTLTPGTTLPAYDFIIVQSHKSRSLHDKIRLFHRSPWVSVHGFYTGPEFHRAEFATQRILNLINQHQKDTASFYCHAHQKLRTLPKSPSKLAPLACVKILNIAFALGGVDPLRSYFRWATLAALLSQHFKINVTLVGSHNAVDAAQEFQVHWPHGAHNLTGQTSLAECRKVIHDQDIFVACDGGLMHLATTTTVKLVGLFNAGVSPEWRLPRDWVDSALQSATADVNGIEPHMIMSKIIELLQIPAPIDFSSYQT